MSDSYEKKETLYLLIVATLILFLAFFTKYDKGVKVGTWGFNRSINWGWNFGF